MTATADVFTHSTGAERNRQRKAVLLATALRAAGLTEPPEDSKTRRALEKTMGVRRSSDETWALAARCARWQASILPSYPLGVGDRDVFG